MSADSPGASPSPAATSRPMSSCAAAGCSRSSRASGSRSTSRSADGWVAGLGEYDGARDRRRAGTLRRPGVHRRAHAPRVVEAAARRVRAPRAAARDDRGRRRPARDRERARHGRRALAARRVGADFRSTSTSWPRRACPRRASSRRGARSSEGDLEALLRRRRVLGLAEMMNFPGVVSGDERELAKLALAHARRRPRAGRRSARELQAYAAAGIRSDHEASTRRGGTRAAARRHVAAHPRGVGRAQPARAAAARRRVRPASDRVLHRRPRARAHRRGRAHQRDGARRGRVRRSRPRTRSSWRRTTRRTTTGSTISARSRPARQADLLVLGDLERLRPGARAQARQAGGRDPASRRCPTGCGTPCGSARSAPEVFRIPWSGGAARVIGLVPGQIITESLVDEPTQRGGEAIADPERDLAKIAVIERHLGTGRIGLGFVRGFGLRARRARLDALARRAQRGRGRRRRHVDGVRGRAGWRISAAGSSSSTAGGCSPSCRCRSPGILSDAPLAEVVAASEAVVAAARELGCEIEAPFQLLAFLALSVIPGAEDHRPRPRRRRAVRARPAAGRMSAAARERARRHDGRRGHRASRRLGARRERPRRGRRREHPAGGGGDASTSAARSSRPASSTRTTTCTRRSRAPARSRPTSSRGCASSIRSGPASTRSRSTRPRAPGSPSSRSRAARPSSTTTTSSRAARAA